MVEINIMKINLTGDNGNFSFAPHAKKAKESRFDEIILANDEAFGQSKTMHIGNGHEFNNVLNFMDLYRDLSSLKKNILESDG